MNPFFIFNQRLGIFLPDLLKEWEELDRHIQQEILVHWETIRGSIPDRIKELEMYISHKQKELSNENNFSRSCILNSEISELASIINDLWIWYRTNPHVSEIKLRT